MDQGVLQFASHVLEINHIPVHHFSLPLEPRSVPNLGLWQAVLCDFDNTTDIGRFLEKCADKMVYFFSDRFHCRYVVLRLGAQEFLACGPALFEPLPAEQFSSIADSFDLPPQISEQLRDYYRQISVSPSQQTFFSIVTALAEHIYGVGAFQIVSPEGMNLTPFPDWGSPSAQAAESPLLSMQLLEYRYELEQSLMYAVGCGDQLRASESVSKLFSTRTGCGISDKLRSVKDDLLGLNSLLRISAEQAKVHPMHINACYTRCLRQCEALTSVDQALALAQHFVGEYCRMVRQFTQKYKSPLIKRVIRLIDEDLTANLTLKNIAAQVYVSPSYLSSLFSREVGIPLTDYVNRRRIERAKFLLRTNNLQIKYIVEQVGISDVYYFSRLFKRIVGTTPSNYRASCRSEAGPEAISN